MLTAPGSRRRLELAALVAAVVLVALVLALLPPADASFAGRTTNSGDSMGAADFFTCDAAIRASAPVVYYKLDETSGTVATNSGSGGAGTYQGTTGKGRARACVRDTGTAVTFDGTSASNGYVSLATRYSVPTTYSLEVWVRTSTTTGGMVAGFGAAATGASTTVDRVLYLTNGGRFVFGINNASKATVSSGTGYNDGAWHHVVVTLGTGGMGLYVDGARVASSTTVASGSYSGYLRVGYDILSGWTNAPTSNYLAGTLDEVAAYTTTLTATDVTSHYQAGV